MIAFTQRLWRHMATLVRGKVVTLAVDGGTLHHKLLNVSFLFLQKAYYLKAFPGRTTPANFPFSLKRTWSHKVGMFVLRQGLFKLLSDDIKPLEYWKYVAVGAPRLVELVFRLFALAPTEAAVERSFRQELAKWCFCSGP